VVSGGRKLVLVGTCSYYERGDFYNKPISTKYIFFIRYLKVDKRRDLTIYTRIFILPTGNEIVLKIF